ncbi:MAG: nitroreductase family protein [Treponema sp.]|nr:nitroreductase family protein [Treponema sp.]
MKKVFGICMMVFFVFPAFSQENPGLKVIVNHFAARNFIAGNISRSDLDQILQSGVRAPSASNQQPWHFTVVQNQTLAKRIVSNVVEGNVLIVISTAGGRREFLDCALAAENIYLAAQALGYGSRLYTGPIDALNQNLKGDVGLPSGHSAVILVRVGKVQAGADAVSAASARKAANEVVSYK